jgi:hypothetical protein
MHEGGKGRKIRKEKKRKMVVPMFWRGGVKPVMEAGRGNLEGYEKCKSI